MSGYMPVVWLVIAALAVIFEALSASLVSIWFIPSALIALALSFAGADIWIQAAVFFVLSVVLIVMSRTIFRRFLRQKTVRTGFDALIGEKAIVTKTVSNRAQTGAVKIDGKTWTARLTDDSMTAEPGSIVTVEAIEGVKLICSPESPESGK